MILYEWVAARGLPSDGALVSFRAKLPPAQRADLDRHTLIMEGVDTFEDLPPGMIAGPIRVQGRAYQHIYKLKLGGRVRLRPLLCKGPKATDDNQRTATFLVGAIERGDRLDPRSAPEMAQLRRDDIINGTGNRRRYETPPEE